MATRRSIKDLERIADRITKQLNNVQIKISQNASGYNVYKIKEGEAGYHLAYAGNLSDCIAFLDGFEYALMRV